MAARSDHLSNLSLRSATNLIYVSYFFGTCGVGLGLLASFAPLTMANRFGLPIRSTPPESYKLYIETKGVRDLAVGLLFFVLGAQRNVKGLGALMLVQGLVGLGDAFVVWKRGVKSTVPGPAIGGALTMAIGAKILELF